MIALMSKWVYGFIKHNSSSQSMNQKFFKFSCTNIKYIFEISVFHSSVGETYKIHYYLLKISSEDTVKNIHLIELQWLVQFNYLLIGKSSVENWKFSVFFKNSWIQRKIYLYLWIITEKKIILWQIEALKKIIETPNAETQQNWKIRIYILSSYGDKWNNYHFPFFDPYLSNVKSLMNIHNTNSLTVSTSNERSRKNKFSQFR